MSPCRVFSNVAASVQPYRLVGLNDELSHLARKGSIWFRVLFAILALGLSAEPALAIEGAAIVYGLDTPSEQAFQRLLKEKNVRYVCAQQVFTKAWSAALLNALGDILAQLVVDKKDKLDYKRLGIFTILVILCCIGDLSL